MPNLRTRVQLKDIVATQLPEFVRSEYPTFVAFVEAYYEFLENNQVDINKIRDIDETLEEFIKYFKAELAHNYPVSSSYDTERYLLKHIRDQYLAKGSEASYKLLFRLLYGKDVYLDYPGRQMLRVSDGRWQQDVSIFVKVEFGDPYSLIGKTVSIQTSKEVYRTTIGGVQVTGSTNLTKVTSNIENVLHFENDIYELFLDRKFYGDILPYDTIKYKNDFQGQVYPCTSKIKIQQRGLGFRPGQVFQVASGDGSSIWFKVLETIDEEGKKGQIKKLDIIKFGVYYTTDFSITILPSSSVSAKTATAKTPVTVTYSIDRGIIGKIDVVTGGSNYNVVPQVIIGGNGTGAAAHAVVEDGVIKAIDIVYPGEGYTAAPTVVVTSSGGSGAQFFVNIDTEEGSPTQGQVLNVTVLNGGSGYSDTDTAVVTGGYYLEEATLGTVHTDNGVVTKIIMDDVGEGYTVATASILSAPGDSGIGCEVEPFIGNGYQYNYSDTTNGFTENGYLSKGDYWDITESGRGATATASISGGEVTGLTLLTGGANYKYNKPIVDIGGPIDSNGQLVEGGERATATATVTDGVITDVTITNQGSGYTTASITFPDPEDGITATGTAVISGGKITNITITNAGSGYVSPVTITISGDGEGATATAVVTNHVITGLTLTSPGSGYITAPKVYIRGTYGYSDGAYVGTARRQFFTDAKDTLDGTPAVLNVSLGALAKYPGYYKTNDGFLDDSMFIQDSYYYQAFSYVLRIDEQLASYASVVRSMLHPSGMAMFGEYSINNQIELSIGLEALVKSLGVTLYDFVSADDSVIYDEDSNPDPKKWTQINGLYFNFIKDVNTNPSDSSTVSPIDIIQKITVNKNIIDPGVSATDPLFTKRFTKLIGATGTSESVTMTEAFLNKTFTKSATDSLSLTETFLRRTLSKTVNDFQPATDSASIRFTLNTINDQATSGLVESGYVIKNPYDQGSYFLEIYVNPREATFS